KSRPPHANPMGIMGRFGCAEPGLSPVAEQDVSLDSARAYDFDKSTQMISLSFRQTMRLSAKAGWDQTTERPRAFWLGLSRLARPNSSYPFGESLVRIKSP